MSAINAIWLHKGDEEVLVNVGSEAESLWRAKGYAAEGEAPPKASKPAKSQPDAGAVAAPGAHTPEVEGSSPSPATTEPAAATPAAKPRNPGRKPKAKGAQA